MSLIDGIGDEVIQFLVAVLLCLVVLVAWWSTGYTTNNERFRTVVIMERNVRRLYNLMPRITGSDQQHRSGIRVYHLTTNTIHPPQETSPILTSTVNINSSTSTGDNQLSQEVQTDAEPAVNSSSDQEDNEESQTEETPQENNSAQNISPQEIEMNRIVNAMESVACSIRNRRIAYYDNQTDNSEAKSDANDSNSELAGPSTQSGDKSTNEKSSEENRTEDSENADPDNIRIRLKYLNDDSKLVEGSLQEPLGEFKRRHFRVEMSARKLVRLIFNGKVLHREAATLASCGLFDNCVVHCLIHQPRTQSQVEQVQQQLSTSGSQENTSNSNNNNQGPHVHTQQTHIQTPAGVSNESVAREDRDWDLSHILLTILASILSIAWYCHIRFSSLFGAAASVAMLGLTALYVFAVICVYYPETATEMHPIPRVNTTREQQRNDTT